MNKPKIPKKVGKRRENDAILVQAISISRKYCKRVLKMPNNGLNNKKVLEVITQFLGFDNQVKYKNQKDFLIYLYKQDRLLNITIQYESTLNKKPPREKLGFYDSESWRLLRLQVFKKYGRVCMKCGSKKKLHIDHIKPRSLYPDLELTFNNLQVLCETCNMEKSNKNCIDYRPDRKRNLKPITKEEALNLTNK
jgi:hypothetical protein